MEFERAADWSVSVFVDGQKRLHLTAPSLGWALFDAYVGAGGHFKGEARAEIARSVRELRHA